MSIRNLIILFVTLCLISCAGVVEVTKDAETQSIKITNTGIVQKTVVVDLNVKERSRQETTFTIPVKEQKENPYFLDKLKEQTVAELLKRRKADVLVEPRFEVETAKERVTITVTGFPAEYTNFRSFQPQDTLWLSKNSREASVYSRD